MQFETTLAGYDRDVARADAAWVRWQSSLLRDPELAKGEAPLGPWQHVAGKSAYETVRQLATSPVDEPWKQGLLRWVLVLTQRRVEVESDLAWAQAIRERSAHVMLERAREVSWVESWHGLVASRERASAEAFLAALAERGPALRSLMRERAERRVEVAHRLGLPHAYALATTMPLDTLRSAALTVLARTEDLARATLREVVPRGRAPHPLDGLELALVRDAPEGWPARLTPRWLADRFPRLSKGLSLHLQVPAAVGASSFVRALGCFGKALRRAGPEQVLPFALARDPYSVDVERFGFFFASLAASPVFQKRALKNVSRVAVAQARTIARGLLIDVRSIAVRALLADDRAAGRADAFDELTSRLFGGPLPKGLEGVWPPTHDANDDGWTRLLALLTVAPFVTDTIEHFDVDWFDNPRANEYLRARASGPARDTPDGAPLDARPAADVLAAWFERALG
jgi:hypothetical protein